MIPKQKVKIEWRNGDKSGEVFFWDHTFKTAEEHAQDYIKRNEGKLEMNMYHLNPSMFGPKWI